MEVLVAILWYINVLIPGVTYTVPEVQTAIDTHIVVIEQIQEDDALLNSILSDYNDDIIIDEDTDVAQPIDIEEKPIRN